MPRQRQFEVDLFYVQQRNEIKSEKCVPGSHAGVFVFFFLQKTNERRVRMEK